MERGAVARERTQQWLAIGIAAVLVVVLIVLPLVMLVYGSLRDAPPGLPGVFTAKNYEILREPDFLSLVKNSLIVTCGSTILAMVVGGGLAFVLVRLRMPMPRLLDMLVTVPAYVTPFIGAIGWSLLLSPRVGYLNHFFELVGLPTIDIYSLGGMVWVMGIYEAPIVYLYLRPALSRIDRSLEEVGRVMGASPTRTARSIIVPLLMPASLSALLLCFVNLLGQFGVPGVLGGPEGINVIPTYLVTLVQQYPVNPNAASVLGVALTVTTMVLLWVSNRVLGKRDYTTVVGKGRYEPGPTSRRMRWIGVTICLVYVFLTEVLPMGMMFFASFQKVFTPDFGRSGFTLANYKYVLSYPSLVTSISNTLLLALATAVIGSVLALLLGFIVVRTRLPGRHVVEQIAIAPLAIPPSVFGLALLWTWITVPVGVYGTLLVLLLAYLALFLPYTTRAAIGAFRQVSVDLEDASRVLGGSWLLTLRRIVAPLVGPAILGGAIIVLYHSVRELAASLLLYAVGTQVISVAIWEMFNEGQYLELFAMSTVQVLIVLVLVLVVRLLGRRFVGVDATDGRATPA